MLRDSVALTQKAIQEPLDTKPLLEMAEPDKKVVIGFPDHPYGGFSGGYSMLGTGFSGWESIASHH